MRRYFSSQPVYNAPVAAIDRECGVIRGVTVAKAGLAKGHEAWLDRTFLLQIVDQANTRPQGIKARFGHPNMCSTALGTYLGRFHNYSYAGDKVMADLHLDETAKNTPNGNLHEYILDMAEKNPDMFGASIAFESSDFEAGEEEVDGKKEKRNYFRLKDLRATDIVDEPAATDGLFSAETMPGMLSRFLDENPDLAEFIYTKPENVIEFLTNYLNNNAMNFSDTIRDKFLALFSGKPTPPVPAIADGSQPAQPLATAEAEPPVEPDKATSPAEVVPPPLGGGQEEVLATRDAELQTLRRTLSEVEGQLASARDQIADLTDRLAARPSIPLNVTDPQVSANLHTADPDDTGKQILASLPRDLKHKLKSK
jgi:hypothetical protein